MGLFKGMSEAKASQNNEYIRPGNYLVYIHEFFVKQNRKEIPITGFSFQVVHIIDLTEAERAQTQPHTVGEKMSWVMQLGKDSTKPNLKRALMNITGVPEDSVNDDFCEALASTSQPLQGMFVELNAIQILTREKKTPFTKVNLRRRWTSTEVLAVEGIQQVLDALKIDTKRADPKAA